ncbi:MAG: acetate kinase [Candidatus Omnitrophota bacterium]|jgi:acetate kinase|nr:MAG: acetate kinase [Candidatus Omnitrophota bacterium]
MKILVLNCGSSSVKFQLFETETETALLRGLVEKIGSSSGILSFRAVGKHDFREIREVVDHEEAVGLVLSILAHPEQGVVASLSEIGAVGHRVVHGGQSFSESVMITDKVLKEIEHCCQFAPLHNPHNLKGIEGIKKKLPSMFQVAVFDTAFHQHMPAKAYLYGLPYALYEKHGIRKYGFHGTSHRYVAQRAADILGKPLKDVRFITCHLGNGASISAVKNGVSVDTSMGFTPLEGLVMGTRCGDIDPAVIPYLMEIESLNSKQIDALMNKFSGMLGLTETSNDMREIEQEASAGSERHKLALDIYAYRIKKYIGAYAAAMGGLDAVIFTGGIGENSRTVRRLILENMEFMGIVFDPKKNEDNAESISTGSVKALIVPTNEELAIARDTAALYESMRSQEKPGVEERQSLKANEKRELVLLWARNPKMNLYELTTLYNQNTGKSLSADVIGKEIKSLGLETLAEAK